MTSLPGQLSLLEPHLVGELYWQASQRRRLQAFDALSIWGQQEAVFCCCKMSMAGQYAAPSPVVLLQGVPHGSPPRVKKRPPWQLQGDALESSASSGCLGRLCLRAHLVLLGFVWAGSD